MKITQATTAIVVGGASGLGAAVAEALVQRGARVVVFDLNTDAAMNHPGFPGDSKC